MSMMDGDLAGELGDGGQYSGDCGDSNTFSIATRGGEAGGENDVPNPGELGAEFRGEGEEGGD